MGLLFYAGLEVGWKVWNLKKVLLVFYYRFFGVYWAFSVYTKPPIISNFLKTWIQVENYIYKKIKIFNHRHPTVFKLNINQNNYLLLES
jgi:hypothetical protein